VPAVESALVAGRAAVVDPPGARAARVARLGAAAVVAVEPLVLFGAVLTIVAVALLYPIGIAAGPLSAAGFASYLAPPSCVLPCCIPCIAAMPAAIAAAAPGASVSGASNRPR